MDAAVGNQSLQREPRHFATHRIEAGDNDRLGGVVDDQIDAGRRLDRPDIAPFATDDPPLHLIGRQRHDADGLLGHIIAGIALNRQSENLLRLLVGNLAGLVLDLLDPFGGIVARFTLHRVHDQVFRLLTGHAGNLLQTLFLRQQKVG